MREALLGTWPGRFSAEQLTEAVALGEDGLGLDSIELVEVLFACEEACDGPSSAPLLEDGPLTLGRVLDHFADK